MSLGISADTVKMDLSGKQTIGFVEDLERELENLKNNVDGLRSIWSGSSSDSFLSSFEEQQANLHGFFELLNEFGVAIRESATIYDDNEEYLADRGKNLGNDDIFNV